MKKILVLALSVFLAACGQEGAPADAAPEAQKNKVIKIAASVTPHAEILREAQKYLAKDGYTLDIQEFNDYIQPNNVVESGEFLANYVEHKPFMDDINRQNNLHMSAVAGIHYEPFGIYPGKTSKLEELQDGAEIAVPNDTTNEARALLLLQENGLLKLKDDAGITATINDILENPKNIKIVEVEAAQLPRLVKEVDMAVINGNYAIAAGFSVGRDAVASEKSDSLAAKTYVNILVVKEGNEQDPGIQALVKVLKSREIVNFINAKYDGAVVPFVE